MPACAARSYWFQPLLFRSCCSFLPNRTQMSSFAIPKECLYPLGYVVAYRIPGMEPNELKEVHETKADVYATWAVINRSFEQIISGLAKLQKMGVLNDDYVTDQDTLTNDLWAKINTQIMADVGRREEDDRTHYGNMRATMERRIRGRQ